MLSWERCSSTSIRRLSGGRQGRDIGLGVVGSSTNKSYSSPTRNTEAGRQVIEGDGMATDDVCDRQGVMFK
jgi:hypothetical protein